jgi:glycosyltransferase involved in cell wall biosynthesis
MVRDAAAWLDEHAVRFLIVGDGQSRAVVQSLVQDEHLAKYVVWPGLVVQSAAPAYLAMMDILLSPHVPNADGSRFFGSPTKLFEYMSMARPVIASRLGQIEDVLSPGLLASRLPQQGPTAMTKELAVLADPGNVEELAAAMRFLVERGDWRVTLGLNARREVLEKYQWSHHVSEILRGIEANVHKQT